MSPVQSKELRRAYGFDEVSIVPGDFTVNPEQASTEFSIGPLQFAIPVLASAMDAVVNPSFAKHMADMGGLAIMNLDGLQCRYEDADEVLREIASAPQDQATTVLQKLYSAPLQDRLVGQRVQELKESGNVCAVSITPAGAKRLSPMAVEAGADIVVIQSTVTTARHISKSYRGLVFSELIDAIKVPIVVGNCVTYNVALELMETGIDGILVGLGPGAACTTREVVGVGIPQVTATLDCSAAREEYYRRTGRYVSVITDGGIRTGGDLCKALVSGADGVMLGSPMAQAKEAPGKGYNWGMASPHAALPRGTRIKVGTRGPLKQILFGPTARTDGTENLMGALRECIGMCGVLSIRELHKANLVIAPGIRSEGKLFQSSVREQ